MVKPEYTKADYEEAARSLANSIVTYSHMSDVIERRIRILEEMAAEFSSPASQLQVDLLKAAWERARAYRAERGTCLGCDHTPPRHYPGCPADGAGEAAETLERR